MVSAGAADWVSVEEARDTILRAVPALPPERRPLLDCLGAALAEDIRAPVDLPPWDNSAMDGFAVRAADVRGASPEQPRELPVADDVAAGHFPSSALRAGTAVRVMTGAPVPQGADSVIRVEHTDGGVAIGAAGARVRVLSDADAGRNVRPRGEDLRRGQLALGKGIRLGAAELGVAAALGCAELSVGRRPVVAVLTSGDELVDIHGFAEVMAGRKIVSSTSYALAAALAECGAEARLLGIAADTPESLRDHLERALGCDALVTTAGLSVGEHDYVRRVLREFGLREAFWRVRMRPGSPFAFGRLDELGGVPWFGLPGNPVSSLVTFEIFVRPALHRLAGHERVFAPTVRATILDDYAARPGLTHFARVRLRWTADSVEAELTGTQSSGALSSLAAADGLLVVPENLAGARAGESFATILPGGLPLRAEPGW
jgi:molybdopterin molybdotransferase